MATTPIQIVYTTVQSEQLGSDKNLSVGVVNFSLQVSSMRAHTSGVRCDPN